MIYRLRARKPPHKTEAWHSWFAWRPVIILKPWLGDEEYMTKYSNGTRITVWLKRIERRGTPVERYDGAMGGTYTRWIWEYRLIEGIR